MSSSPKEALSSALKSSPISVFDVKYIQKDDGKKAEFCSLAIPQYCLAAKIPIKTLLSKYIGKMLGRRDIYVESYKFISGPGRN